MLFFKEGGKKHWEMLAKPCVLRNIELSAEELEPGGLKGKMKRGLGGLQEEVDPLACSWRNARDRVEQVRARMAKVAGRCRWKGPVVVHLHIFPELFLSGLHKLFSYLKLSGWNNFLQGLCSFL